MLSFCTKFTPHLSSCGLCSAHITSWFIKSALWLLCIVINFPDIHTVVASWELYLNTQGIWWQKLKNVSSAAHLSILWLWPVNTIGRSASTDTQNNIALWRSCLARLGGTLEGHLGVKKIKLMVYNLILQSIWVAFRSIHTWRGWFEIWLTGPLLCEACSTPRLTVTGGPRDN